MALGGWDVARNNCYSNALWVGPHSCWTEFWIKSNQSSYSKNIDFSVTWKFKQSIDCDLGMVLFVEL